MAIVVVYETETFWPIPFNAIAPPSVTGTIVPPAIVLPLASTFHIATLRAAAPLPDASGRSCLLNVHVPAGNVTPALESTVHPVQDDGIAGVEPLTAVFETEFPVLTPGTNGAHPVAPDATRLSASGNAAPIVDVFASV